MNLPIACTLGPAALSARRQGLLADLVARAAERADTSDGVRLRFDAGDDALRLVTAAVDAERQCCRFLKFAIVVEPDGGPIWLELSGPPGTGEFLSALLDA